MWLEDEMGWSPGHFHLLYWNRLEKTFLWIETAACFCGDDDDDDSHLRHLTVIEH